MTNTTNQANIGAASIQPAAPGRRPAGASACGIVRTSIVVCRDEAISTLLVALEVCHQLINAGRVLADVPEDLELRVACRITRRVSQLRGGQQFARCDVRV